MKLKKTTNQKETKQVHFQVWNLELNFNVESQTSYDLTPTQANKWGGRGEYMQQSLDQQVKLGARKEMLQCHICPSKQMWWKVHAIDQ